jgi:hypothetical protein
MLTPATSTGIISLPLGAVWVEKWSRIPLKHLLYGWWKELEWPRSGDPTLNLVKPGAVQCGRNTEWGRGLIERRFQNLFLSCLKLILSVFMGAFRRHIKDCKYLLFGFV